MTNVSRACALGLALVLTATPLGWAADQTIILKLGAETALMLDRPFETVLIGDPKVVDVYSRGDRSVTIEPLDLGATNLVFVDERSIAIANIRVLVCNAGAIPAKGPDGFTCE